jgi:tripartite-type tricarboxylate transporter receptor subunit TctC
MLKLFLRYLFLPAALLCAFPLHAAEFPVRPIRLIVPYAAGGPVDVMARLLGPSLAETLGQPVIVENKPGAGGFIGTLEVVRSRPDGYTLLLTTNGADVILPLTQEVPYDPLTALAPVTLALRFMQRHQIMLDHFGSGINCDQTCKWAIEWDTCAPGLLSYVASDFPSSCLRT